MAVIGKVLSGFSSCQRINLFSITRYNKRNLSNCSVLYATSLSHTRFNKYISLSHYFSTSKYSVSSGKSQIRTMAGLSPLDPSSFSRPEIAIIKHISLNLNVAFENKTLNGSAVLDIDILEDCNELILDSNQLCIESVQLEDGSELEYTEDNLTPKLYGTKLTIKLPKQQTKGDKKYVNFNQECCEETEIVPTKRTQSTQVPGTISLNFTGYMYEIVEDDLNADYQVTNVGKSCINPTKSSQTCSCKKYTKLKIKIIYKTSANATALQWLEPSQTSGKKFPYLFSQCQPIHARSILPCQDTPAVKFTYDAEITAPEEFTVLMSALRGKSAGVKTAFTQPIPIPSYLLALAVGVLEYRRLGPRSLVWAEKEEIERSAWEFADTEKYLQAAEKLCGQYQWSQYDLLVLPPSFPYGGMENPCLTFVTPTLLAGDRSQADVIVHEIMHSWTGNLVTNRNFEHFWLNEGFTVFLERKVASSLIADSTEAKKIRDFHSLLGLQELSETVNDHLGVNSPLTNLVPSLKGVHPDDAFSRVPYEKGSLFLRYLEDTVGGPEVFDGFLRSYLNKFQRKSLDTNEFKEALFEYFKNDKENSDKLKAIDWNSWLYTSGMPPIIPDYDTSMTKAISSLVAKISNTSLSYEDVKAFTPHQIINLLQELIDRPPLSMDKVRQLGEAYKVNDSKNSEIQYRWIRLCIRSRDFDKLDDAFEFVNNVGRMKYVRPIYRDLYAWEEVRQRAIDNFLKHEQCMMHVTAYTLRKDLHLNA